MRSNFYLKSISMILNLLAFDIVDILESSFFLFLFGSTSLSLKLAVSAVKVGCLSVL